jgi:hypothetical protein
MVGAENPIMSSNGSYAGNPNDPPVRSENVVKKSPHLLSDRDDLPGLEKRSASLGLFGKGWNVSGANGTKPLPVWAVQMALAALRTGMPAPEVERRLHDGGLSQEAAEDVVSRVLARRLQDQDAATQSLGRKDWLESLLDLLNTPIYMHWR